MSFKKPNFINKNTDDGQRINNSTNQIYIDSNLKRWFSRNIGLWKSQRQYIFKNDEVHNVTMFIKVEKNQLKDNEDGQYKFSWWPLKEYEFFKIHSKYKQEGQMQAHISGHQLIREQFYLSDKKGISNIKQIDEHELVFESNYDQWLIIEHARLINQDELRFRFIYSWNQDNLEIVESHHEIKVE
tara:strand:- start:2575 stop:3129 length:555 start_codon:yes stop_codon:yes gene_type:complete